MNEFQQACVDRYGDKVKVTKIEKIDESVREIYGDEWANAALEYPAQVWLAPSKDENYHCPECDSIISGLFGSVEWAIRHGVMYCTNCEKVSFLYYHYPLKNGERLKAWALYSIPKE